MLGIWRRTGRPIFLCQPMQRLDGCTDQVDSLRLLRWTA